MDKTQRAVKELKALEERDEERERRAYELMEVEEAVDRIARNIISIFSDSVFDKVSREHVVDNTRKCLRDLLQEVRNND